MGVIEDWALIFACFLLALVIGLGLLLGDALK